MTANPVTPTASLHPAPSPSVEWMAPNQIVDGRFRLRECRREVAPGIVEWLAEVRETGKLVALKLPTTREGAERLALEWRTIRRLTSAEGPIETVRRQTDGIPSGGPATDSPPRPFAGYMACEIVPLPSVIDRLRAGETVSAAHAIGILDAVLDVLDRCQRQAVPPPDLAQPCIFQVGERICVEGVGTDVWDAVMPKLKALAGALGREGEECDETAENLGIVAFAESLPDRPCAFSARHLRSLLSRLTAATAPSGRLRSAQWRDIHVTCPGCHVEYVLAAGVCRKCRIDLFSGGAIDADHPQRQPRRLWPRVSSLTTWIVAAGMLGFFAVVASVFGWPWVLATVGMGALLAVAAVLTALVSH